MFNNSQLWSSFENSQLCRKEKFDHMNIVMKPRTLVTSVLHCRFHDNIHVIKFSFLQGWLLSNEGRDLNVLLSNEYVRNIKKFFVVFFVLWLYWVLNLKKKHMYKTLLSLQKKFMWRQNFLIFSLFIKRSGNRRNAPKLSYMYICTFQDINKQTLLQWQLTSYHNIIIHFTFTHK